MFLLGKVRFCCWYVEEVLAMVYRVLQFCCTRVFCAGRQRLSVLRCRILELVYREFLWWCVRSYVMNGDLSCRSGVFKVLSWKVVILLMNEGFSVLLYRGFCKGMQGVFELLLWMGTLGLLYVVERARKWCTDNVNNCYGGNEFFKVTNWKVFAESNKLW